MSEIKLRLHAPVQQYGFVEIEGTAEQKEELEALYNRYTEKPVQFDAAPTGDWKRVKTWTDEVVMYDPIKHKYVTEDGHPLISGSAYAEKFADHFDKEKILPATAKKLGCSPETLDAAWAGRGDMAKSLGTALHKAMEVYFKYKQLGYGTPKNVYLKSAVDTFPLKDRTVEAELMVSDVSNRMVGQIDGLLVKDQKKKLCEIIDYKSDADVKKNLVKHFNQLSFYAAILLKHGWTVDKVSVWNFTDKWEEYSSPVLPLSL